MPEASKYTGYCFRRTAATLHSDAGGSIENLQRLGGWKSRSIAQSYVDANMQSKVNNATLIAGSSRDEFLAPTSMMSNIQTNKSVNVSSSVVPISSGTFNNCTFNIGCDK